MEGKRGHFLRLAGLALLALVCLTSAGDGRQVPGRGIGLTEEERLSAATELAAEEAKRFAESAVRRNSRL